MPGFAWPLVIAVERLPEDEKDRAFFIGSSLSSLRSYCSDLEAALRLFDRSYERMTELRQDRSTSEAQSRDDEIDLMRRWMFMAARDGAITLYNFDGAMKSIVANLARCPVMHGLVDLGQRRRAMSDFKKHFPRIVDVRNSVGHAGDSVSSPEGLSKHGGQRKVVVVNSLNGRTFTTTRGGHVASYDLSSDSLEQLRAICADFCAAFAPLSRFGPTT